MMPVPEPVDEQIRRGEPTREGTRSSTSSAATRRETSTLTLRDVLQVVQRSWLIIVATIVAALAGGWVITAVTPASYETEAQVLVRPAVSGDAGNMAQTASFVDDQVATYAALAETPIVLDAALEQSGLDLASTDVVADVVPQTSIISLTVRAGAAEDAARLADAVTVILIEQIEAQTPAGGAVRVTGDVVASPTIPGAPSSPDLTLNLLVALAVGLLVAFLVIVIKQALGAGTQER
jgi:capsular polysaccharide biosynthesis protein